MSYVVESPIAVGLLPALYEIVYRDGQRWLVVAVEEVEKWDPPRLEQFDGRVVAQAGIYRFTLEPVSEGAPIA